MNALARTFARISDGEIKLIPKSRYDGVGRWAKDSSDPPLGWPLTIALAIAFILVAYLMMEMIGLELSNQHIR